MSHPHKSNMTTRDFSFYPQNFNRNMQIINPTYDQHILKTPEANITNGRIPERIVIDSNDRDKFTHCNPSKYVYKLNHHIRDVISIELAFACIPYTGYIINENNNRLFFQETSGITLIATVPPGNYTPEQLAIELEIVMNLEGESIYTVTYNVNTEKYTIESDLVGGDGFFSLFFCNQCKNSIDPCCEKCDANDPCPNSIGPKLGFLNKTLTAESEYTSQAIQDVNDEKYIILRIRELNRLISNNKHIDDSFATFIFNNNHGSNFIYNLGDSSSVDGSETKFFNPPLPKLDRFTIEFLTRDGREYDFNGRNHLLDFSVISLNSPGIYTTLEPKT